MTNKENKPKCHLAKKITNNEIAAIQVIRAVIARVRRDATSQMNEQERWDAKGLIGDFRDDLEVEVFSQCRQAMKEAGKPVQGLGRPDDFEMDIILPALKKFVDIVQKTNDEKYCYWDGSRNRKEWLRGFYELVVKYQQDYMEMFGDPCKVTPEQEIANETK